MKSLAALLLIASTALAQSKPIGSSAETQPAFSVVSIHPHDPNLATVGYHVAPDCHEITVANLTLGFLISNAYNLKEQRFLVGGPSWIDTARFDLQAKLDPAELSTAKLTEDQCFALLRPVLADRFQLRLHHETRPTLVYNIAVAKGGLRMRESTPVAGSAQPLPCRLDEPHIGSATARSCPMEMITHLLEDGPDRFVIDKTGLSGRYDFDLHWTPDNTPADSPVAGGPSIFTAVQEQLGLKLSPSTISMDVLVIDSAQKPSEN